MGHDTRATVREWRIAVQSLLRVAFTRRGLTKLCIIICYVLNEIKN